ncbi:ATP-binding protein [Candidatus Lariskella endosymbiont of Hedychridium roseum]|uniref:AAA family ATPase n=1 Tax=Candidatus Lariskella endosymbiont of Hedychridium roseum TaxID=3077949 RepID=UPI0030CF844B
MSDSIFIGRRVELERLQALYKKKTSSLVVVKGRRRIGKSRLILEFVKTIDSQTFWSFAGLAPQDGISPQAQRDNFARQLSLMLKVPPITFQDWSDAFEHLSLHINPGDIILFDEISWIGSKDPTFIPKLKAWWDKQTTHMLLVFCGSVSTWIEENILKSTAFFGRVNLTLNLEPLSITESAQFLRKTGIKMSPYDKYKLLCIIGGVPWYLEQLNPKITADENIKQLAFEKSGLLVTEFDRIFHDLFDGKGTTYKKILDSLKDGAKTLSEIRTAIKFPHSGTLSQMMEHLIVAGFIVKQSLWSFKTTRPLKQSLYAISDPYMRFYLKMIEPNLAKISINGYANVTLQSLPGFEIHLGLQLEYLLLQNRSLIFKAIGIHGIDIVSSGPYRQMKTSTQQGCQIDYLVQTVTKNLFICEFKFKKREVNSDIINEVQDKITKLKVPRGFASIPVLLHLSGITDSVATSSYFYRIIDIVDFLES